MSYILKTLLFTGIGKKTHVASDKFWISP